MALTIVCSLYAQPYRVAGNLSTDLTGVADTRVGTWGTTGVTYHEIKFNNVPTGLHVRILRIQGDTIAWPIHPGFRRNGNAGILSGFTTRRDPMGAPALCTLCSADVLTYVQATVTPTGATRVFKYNYKKGFLLPTRSLWLKQAVYLNTFVGAMHIETTYNITFDYASPEVQQ